MRNIPFNYFVNDSTINIFTDASIEKVVYKDRCKNERYYYIGSPGYIVYIGDSCVESYGTIIPYATNNESEVIALWLAVQRAVQLRSIYPNIRRINLFSDSKLCVYGIREWIYKWFQQQKDGILYGSSGPVVNQNHFIGIVETILNNRLYINFYHVRGHLNVGNNKHCNAFKESFYQENHIGNDVNIDNQFILFCMQANAKVDKYTREVLKDFRKIHPVIQNPEDQILSRPITYDSDYLDNMNMFNYNQYIGGYLLL